jgi:rare lipoprotein A
MVLLVTGCGNTGRYSQKQDSAPTYIPSRVTKEDAIVVNEDICQPCTRPYYVLGQNYLPLSSNREYVATGQASWYGQKFHGHLTANGEVYDMYQMSAAHKTLPIPSYVRVTNLENNKTVVVRVNDRGPFHDDRVIDLSYAAAAKIDMLKYGTTKVKLESIYLDKFGVLRTAGQPTTPLTLPSDGAWYIQVAALSDNQRIQALASDLTKIYQLPTHIPEKGGVYRLRLGPMENEEHATALLETLHNDGFSNAYKLVNNP